jgi:hypothetical protein
MQRKYKRDGGGKFAPFVVDKDKEEEREKEYRIKNKEKKTKKIIKKSCNKIKREDFSFIDDPPFDWIKNITKFSGDKLLKEYDADTLKRIIETAYEWDASRGFKSKNICSTLRTFLKNDIQIKREELARKLNTWD